MSIRSSVLFALGLVCLLSLTACRHARGVRGHGVAAGQASIDVVIQEGSPSEMEARQYQYRRELRTYMEKELPRRFAKYGIGVQILQQHAEHQPATGRSLLIVHFDSYNPGSAAARYTVGYGAGAASLDLTASLFKNNTPVSSWKDGCGTSGHWSRIINKLDDNMAKKVCELLSQR